MFEAGAAAMYRRLTGTDGDVDDCFNTGTYVMFPTTAAGAMSKLRNDSSSNSPHHQSLRNETCHRLTNIDTRLDVLTPK